MAKYTVGIRQIFMHYVHIEVDDDAEFETICETANTKLAEGEGIGDPEFVNDMSYETWDIEKGHG